MDDVRQIAADDVPKDECGALDVGFLNAMFAVDTLFRASRSQAPRPLAIVIGSGAKLMFNPLEPVSAMPN